MGEFNLPTFSLGITFAILSVAMLFRYFSLVGFAYWITQKVNREHGERWRIEPGVTSSGQMRRDIFWSVLSSLIFSLSGTLMIWAWQKGWIDIYAQADKYGWVYLILSAPLLFFIHDGYFYWTHRLLHHPKLFKRIHRVHHESRVPTAWTAFSFHPWEALIQAIVLPVLLFIFPVHWIVLIFFLAMMTILGIMNHLGSEFYPRFLRSRAPFSFMINASHHHQHHKRVHHNYGLYFTFWDLWMKTEFGGEHATR